MIKSIFLQRTPQFPFSGEIYAKNLIIWIAGKFTFEIKYSSVFLFIFVNTRVQKYLFEVASVKKVTNTNKLLIQTPSYLN